MSAGQPPWEEGEGGEVYERARQAKRQERLENLEDRKWAEREYRARERKPVALVPAAEVWDRPDLSWLVDRLIPETGIGAIFGPTGTWKSFLALHLLLCVSCGLGFMGRAVREGWCFYLLGEGQAGARRRVRAGVADLPVPRKAPGKLGYSMEPFALDDPEAVGDFIARAKEMAAGGPTALVVLDAAADFYPPGANENSATDMNPLITQAKRISRELACFVLLIAHSGYETGHQRGTSRFGQAWDFEAETSATGMPGCGWLRVTKVKEDGAGFPVPFHLQPRPVGEPGPDGQPPPVSLAVRHGHPQGAAAAAAAEEAASDGVRKLTATEAVVLDRIIAYLHTHASTGKPMFYGRVREGVTGKAATIRQMLDELVRGGLVEETSSKGHPAYFLPVDEFPYRTESEDGTVCEYRPWEPPEKRFARISPDGTEVVGNGADDEQVNQLPRAR